MRGNVGVTGKVTMWCMLRFDDYTYESHGVVIANEDIISTGFIDENHFSILLDAPTGDQSAFLKALGVGKPYVDALEEKARKNGSTLEAELLTCGLMTEDAYFGAFARFLRLPFLPELDATLVVDSSHIDTQLLDTRMVRLSPSDSKPVIAIVPELQTIATLKDTLERLPRFRDDLVVTTPSALREAVWKTGAERRTRQVVNQLFDAAPHHSARIIFHGNQGFYTGIGLTLLATAFLLATSTTLLWLHLVVTTFYMASLVFRLTALRQRPELSKEDVPASLDLDELPVYSVMVALYREEEIVEQLMSALNRLDWPKSRLDIKIVCEADDLSTIETVKRLLAGAHFEIVCVPPSLPRTKPKALGYALKGARGEFVAIYDAEDRPHPQQLREAYARFRSVADDVACLQAPLIISNANASWISASFSLEYSALFRRMLPMLARQRMPLPLGGTSNHFRTAILREVGAWDPYNVTEDADLGMRLYRLGYRSDVIFRQTLEDAPTDISVWMNQRTRWYKGWLQSWLVMMRAPLTTAREMGWRAYLIFHLMIGGMLLSSLTHPLLIAYVLLTAQTILVDGFFSLPRSKALLFVVDTMNIFGSYAVFLMMGRAAMIDMERAMVGKRWMATPLYWLMLSCAAWRAIVELRCKPFVWNKTPHKPVVRQSHEVTHA